jgi:group I intron endonuclease
MEEVEVKEVCTEEKEDRRWCVYMHTNKVNGKKYIGQTVLSHNPNRRWKNGCGYKNNQHFYSAILKYGWDNFNHDILFDNLTTEEADQIEEYLIRDMDTTNPELGYNLTFGGNANVPSEEAKQKMRDNHADFSGEKNPFFGKSLTEEHNKKLQDGHKQKCSGKNHPFFGKHLSEETKEKLRISHLRENLSIETLERMRNSHPDMRGENNPMFGRKQSDDTKRRIAEKNKKGVIIQLTNEDVFIKEWEYLMKIEKELGISHSNVALCCKHKYHSAGGFHWMYKEDYEKFLETKQNN